MPKRLEEITELLRLKRGSEIVRPGNHSTGIQDLDHLLGGGWADGINLVTGQPGTGKSLIAALSMSQCLEQGIPAILVDSEHGYDLWQRHLPLSDVWDGTIMDNQFLNHGIDLKNTAKRIVQLVNYAQEVGTKVGIVVIDSLDGLLSRDENYNSSFFSVLSYGDPTREELQRATEINYLITALSNLGRKNHIPIIVIQHDYEYIDSYDHHPGVDTAESTNLSHRTNVEEYNHKVMNNLAKKVVHTTTFDEPTPNDRSLSNTSHIAAGHTFSRFGKIDYDNPTHLIIGAFLDTQSFAPRDSQMIYPLHIPFARLSNFEFQPPYTPYEHAIHHARLAPMVGVESEDYEPEDATLWSDEVVNPLEFTEWDGSEVSENRPTRQDPNWGEWE